MPRIFPGLRWVVLGLGLAAVGCDPGHKEAVRTSKVEDRTAWSDPVVSRGSKDDAKAEIGPDAEKAGIFSGKRMQGGLDDTSRDIERNLGVN